MLPKCGHGAYTEVSSCEITLNKGGQGFLRMVAIFSKLKRIQITRQAEKIKWKHLTLFTPLRISHIFALKAFYWCFAIRFLMLPKDKSEKEHKELPSVVCKCSLITAARVTNRTVQSLSSHCVWGDMVDKWQLHPSSVRGSNGKERRSCEKTGWMNQSGLCKLEMEASLIEQPSFE